MNYCLFLRNRLRYRTEISHVYSRNIYVSENINILISTRYRIWAQNLMAGHIYSHEFSNNVIYATSKGSDQPGDIRSLIRAFASHLNIL